MPRSRTPQDHGFWSDAHQPARGAAGAAADSTVLRYLRGGFREATAVLSQSLGPSHCRLGCHGGRAHSALGSATLCSADGAHVWPEGLAHYYAAHGTPCPPALEQLARAAAASSGGSGGGWRLYDECERRAVPMPRAMREHLAATTLLLTDAEYVGMARESLTTTTYN